MSDLSPVDIRHFRNARPGSSVGDVTHVTDVTLSEGGVLLNDIRGFVRRYVVLPDEHCEVAVTLWIAHTWLIDRLDSTPRLAFMSPEPGSGKSRALEVLEMLCPRPMLAVNVSAAVLFRSVSDPATRPTVLFDEIDTIFGGRNAANHEDLRAVLNSGYRRGAKVPRVADPTTNTLHDFHTFAAVALAGLNTLPDTVASRAIPVNMRKRLRTDTVEPFRRRNVEPVAQALTDRIADALRDVESIALPDDLDDLGVRDRDADVWEPLIAVADLLDPHWGKLAREAAVAFVTGREPAVTEGTGLLHDIQGVFDRLGGGKITSSKLVTELCLLEESPWGGDGWSQLTPRSLARLLKPYGISPALMRLDDQPVARGYRRSDFEDAWRRYLPQGTHL